MSLFFELGVADGDRARAFYTGVFGWAMEPGPSGNGYAIDADGVQGGLHGGDAQAVPYVFFDVDDIDAAMERVSDLGGEVLESQHDGDEASIARFGRFRFCRDDQGSPFGLRQPPAG